MPLVAIADGSPVDATVCDDATWSLLHRRRSRPTLGCPVCAGPLHAKVSNRGLRFFAHDPGADCSTGPETPRHLALKVALAAAARSLGWSATLEASGSGWRADVLATTGAGARFALEVQLSSMTTNEGRDRSGRYLADDVTPVWFTDRRRTLWLRELPGAVIAGTGRADTNDGWVVLGPHVRFDRSDRRWWVPAGPTPLPRFLTRVADGTITFDTVPGGPQVRSSWATPTDRDSARAELDQQRAFEMEDRTGMVAAAAVQSALTGNVERLLPLPERSRWVRWRDNPPAPISWGAILAWQSYSSRVGPEPVAVIAPTVLDRSRAGLPIFTTVDGERVLRDRYPDRALRITVVDPAPPPPPDPNPVGAPDGARVRGVGRWP